jgi:putative transposase
MNPPKCNEYDYIEFLIGTQRAYSCLEAEHVQPSGDQMPAHDAMNRLLYRIDSNADSLWDEAEPHVSKEGGMLVIDDSTLDKHYSRKIELVTRHWSGKHRSIVQGNLFLARTLSVLTGAKL